MKAAKKNIKRVLDQIQKAAEEGLASKKQAFGLAIAFITTVLTITKEAKDANEPYSSKVETALCKVIDDAVKNKKLVINTNWKANNEGNEAAILRHLRNCFSHCNWWYDELNVSANNMLINLEDIHKSSITFKAQIQLPDLVDLAEKLLIATYNNMPI